MELRRFCILRLHVACDNEDFVYRFVQEIVSISLILVDLEVLLCHKNSVNSLFNCSVCVCACVFVCVEYVYLTINYSWNALGIFRAEYSVFVQLFLFLPVKSLF